MERLTGKVCALNPFIAGSVLAVFTVAQIVLTFFYRQPGSQALRVFGYALWTLSAIFGILPIITFRRRGGVPKGKSYIHTSILVDSGVYAIVRHPQFLAGILINISCMLIAQHWLIVVLGIPPLLINCLDTHRADRDLVEKFGDDYRHYMMRVPGLNFPLGIARLMHSAISRQSESN